MEENKQSQEKKLDNKKPIQIKILEEVESSIETVLDGGITTDNVKILSELVDIHKDIIGERKETNNMYGNYGNYNGRGPSHGSYGRDEYGYGNYGEYGNYGNYGTRGRDIKYRGDDHLDRMAGEYGRYMESRERYGASPETDKSFEYMVKSLEDFIKYLHEEAETPQHHQILNETLQRSMR